MGRMVSGVTCACALLGTTASCRSLPEATVATAVPNFAVPASAVANATDVDLGGGCSIDPPRATDRRNWAPDGKSVAEVLRDPNLSPTPQLALEHGRTLDVWTEGSVEWGWQLRAAAQAGDGETSPTVTLSTNVVGKPLAVSEPGHVGIVFLEGADYGLREVFAAVHCSP